MNECNSGAPRKKFSRYSRTSHLERISKRTQIVDAPVPQIFEYIPQERISERTQVVEVPMLQNLEGFSPGAHRGAYTEL